MTATAYGWVKGYPDGTFAPNKYITRAEVATVINRILGRAADEDYVSTYADELKQFSDLQDTTKWYYLDMVEAANTHAFLMEDGVETWTKVITSTP